MKGKKTGGNVGGDSKMQEEETREGTRRKPKETHAVKARATTI